MFDQAAYARTATLLYAYYREHGYARVKVDRKAVVDYRDDTAKVTYHLESGPACGLRDDPGGGHAKVEPDVVQAEVTWDPGEPFRQSELDATQKNLAGLKLFPSVRIIEEGGPTDAVVDTRIEVSEGPFHEVQFGIGYDTEEQVRGIASWRDYNFYGDARQLGFTARASFIYRTIAADFIQPHFPGSRDRFRLTLSEQQEDEDTFFNDRSRVSPRIEFRPSPIVTPYVFYRFEYDTLSDVNDADQGAPAVDRAVARPPVGPRLRRRREHDRGPARSAPRLDGEPVRRAGRRVPRRRLRLHPGHRRGPALSAARLGLRPRTPDAHRRSRTRSRAATPCRSSSASSPAARTRCAATSAGTSARWSAATRSAG